jgi:hypothetical protein
VLSPVSEGLGVWGNEMSARRSIDAFGQSLDPRSSKKPIIGEIRALDPYFLSLIIGLSHRLGALLVLPKEGPYLNDQESLKGSIQVQGREITLFYL